VPADGNRRLLDEQPAHLKSVMRAGIRVARGTGLAPSLEEQEIFSGVGRGNDRGRRIYRSAAGHAELSGGIYEEDVQTALGASMALIEPLILIVMAFSWAEY